MFEYSPSESVLKKAKTATMESNKEYLRKKDIAKMKT